MSTGKSFKLPIFSGLLEHRERMGSAIWTFLWMIDRTTLEVPLPDGSALGLVKGGKGISQLEIANDLQMERRGVYEHLERLVKGGYLRKIDHGPGRPVGFAVLKSKKRTVPTSEVLPIGTSAVLPQGRSDFLPQALGSFPHKPRNFSALHNRKTNTRQEKDKHEDEPILPEMVASGVLATCGLSGTDLLAILTDVCRSQLNHGMTADALRDDLVTAWGDFSKGVNDGEIEFAPNATNFFGKGYWNNRGFWKRKEGSSSAGDSPGPPKYTIEERMARLGAPVGVSA